MVNDPYGGYASRKFLLAAFIVATSAVAMFTGHMTGAECGSFMTGAFTVFAGGDVAQNIAHARAGQVPTS